MLLYKYRAINNLEFLADILVKERLFCSTYLNLNDPFEGVFREVLQFPMSLGGTFNRYPVVSTLNEINGIEHSKIRVCSLSAAANSVLMWSHYGSAHQGVAVEIDFSGVEEVKKVNYLEGLAELEEAFESIDKTSDILAWKTFHWAYEKEYRIFTNVEFFDIRGRIRRVLLGPRIRDNIVPVIERLAPVSVKIQHMKLDYDALTVKELYP